MGLRKKLSDKLHEDVVYDTASKEKSKLDKLIFLYDDVNILVFEKPDSKTKIKKIP